MASNDRMDRRKFVALLAAGAAAAATASIGSAASAETRERSAPPAAQPSSRRPMTAAMRKEIETQKKSVADMLRVIRDYELPAGSPPATVFRARRAGRPR